MRLLHQIKKRGKKCLLFYVMAQIHTLLPNYYKWCITLIHCQARRMILPISNRKASINYINSTAITAIITVMMVSFVLMHSCITSSLTSYFCSVTLVLYVTLYSRFPVHYWNYNSSIERKQIKKKTEAIFIQSTRLSFTNGTSRVDQTSWIGGQWGLPLLNAVPVSVFMACSVIIWTTKWLDT